MSSKSFFGTVDILRQLFHLFLAILHSLYLQWTVRGQGEQLKEKMKQREANWSMHCNGSTFTYYIKQANFIDTKRQHCDQFWGCSLLKKSNFKVHSCNLQGKCIPRNERWLPFFFLFCAENCLNFSNISTNSWPNFQLLHGVSQWLWGLDSWKNRIQNLRLQSL